MNNSQRQAMYEDAQEQASFNRRVGYRGNKNPMLEYTDAMQDKQDEIDDSRE